MPQENPQPSWIDRYEYPFASHFLDLDMGRMHYIDEGQGPPLVMVHGTPVWSFLYRHLIKGLSQHYRCLVPDHIGFGLSDKPPDWSYRPRDHAHNLATFIERLGVRKCMLVVHDMGGPIGLSYAIDHPNNVQKLVLFNTWMWSLHDNTAVRRASALLGSWFGRILYMQFNISPRLLIPGMTGDKTKLTKAIHQHYIQALPRPQDRRAAWMVVRELIDSSDWYDHLWQQRQRIANHPALLLWGMKDPSVANGMMDVARWQQLWPHAQTVTFAETGHFVQEEQGSSLVPLLHEFLAS